MPKKQLKVLGRNHKVQKQNELNHMYPLGMTLQQVRLLTIYLSRINRNDVGSRVVRFPLDDFQEIFEIKNVTLANIKKAVDGMLQNIMHVSLEYGFEAFPMFKKSRFTSGGGDEWYVEIDASDDMLPLFFGYKDRFLQYKLWNALRLRSTNQVRMYEIVKEHQWHGDEFELSLDELKLRLGILPEEYREYRDFKKRVLDVCRDAIILKTDLTYEYEPVRKGRGGRVVGIRFFNIGKNDGYVDQFVIEEYLDAPKEYRRRPQKKEASAGRDYGSPTQAELDRMAKLREKMGGVD